MEKKLTSRVRQRLKTFSEAVSTSKTSYLIFLEDGVISGGSPKQKRSERYLDIDPMMSYFLMRTLLLVRVIEDSLASPPCRYYSH